MRLWLLLWLALAAGCATTRPAAELTTTGPASDAGLRTARLVYRQQVCTPRPDDVELVARSEPLSPARVLAITYPHPDHRADVALVEVVVHGAPTSHRATGMLARVGDWADRSLPGVVVDDDGSTAYRLSIAKTELDSLLRTLAAQGTFDDGGAFAGRDQLAVTINGREQQFAIAPDKGLTLLADRVVREGRVARIDDPQLAKLAADARSGQRDSFYDRLLR